MDFFINILSVLMWTVPIGAVVLPIVLARRGVGSRWVWLGGGIGGLVGLITYSILWSMSRGRPSPGRVGFDPVLVYPPETALGGAEGACILSALGFVIAGIFYKPKKKAETSFLGKA